MHVLARLTSSSAMLEVYSECDATRLVVCKSRVGDLKCFFSLAGSPEGVRDFGREGGRRRVRGEGRFASL